MLTVLNAAAPSSGVLNVSWSPARTWARKFSHSRYVSGSLNPGTGWNPPGTQVPSLEICPLGPRGALWMFCGRIVYPNSRGDLASFGSAGRESNTSVAECPRVHSSIRWSVHLVDG